MFKARPEPPERQALQARPALRERPVPRVPRAQPVHKVQLAPRRPWSYRFCRRNRCPRHDRARRTDWRYRDHRRNWRDRSCWSYGCRRFYWPRRRDGRPRCHWFSGRSRCNRCHRRSRFNWACWSYRFDRHRRHDRCYRTSRCHGCDRLGRCHGCDRFGRRHGCDRLGRCHGCDRSDRSGRLLRLGHADPDAAGRASVEVLQAGDAVVTASGETVRIAWVGCRHVDLRRHPQPERAQPIRIAAHAFGRGLPHRDLVVSPGHALFVDGVLIPAGSLVNGTSVAQLDRAEVVYHHVELPVHDVLVADGMPAESYLDCGHRGTFANHDGPVTLHPDFAAVA